MTGSATRRSAATQLADELLADIELARVAPVNMARKASRLARLLDDTGAVEWLRFEVSGYPSPNLDTVAWTAAQRSGRVRSTAEGPRASTAALGSLQASVEAAKLRLAAATDPDISTSSANPNQFVTSRPGNAVERQQAATGITRDQALLDRVVGTIFDYVAETYNQLRFGDAMETAFDALRSEVDASISGLIPEAVQKLASALENCTSENPEDWANAAGTCRRLLVAAADALQPAGEPVNGRAMDESKHINRLMYWIETNSPSTSAGALAVAELDHLGKRIDAVQRVGSKGAHAEVTRYDASRFVTGTYLLLGDILKIADQSQSLSERSD